MIRRKELKHFPNTIINKLPQPIKISGITSKTSQATEYVMLPWNLKDTDGEWVELTALVLVVDQLLVPCIISNNVLYKEGINFL